MPHAVRLALERREHTFACCAPEAAGEELNKSNRTGEFQGVSLLYFPVTETKPGDMCKNNERDFCTRIAQDIEEWLLSRPVPEDCTRFFHGTSSSSMNDILEHGIDQSNFEKIGDFGPGLYCTNTVQTSLRFAMLSALQEGEGRRSASLHELNQIELEGNDWTTFTQLCLRGKMRDAYKAECSALQLVKGMLVHNPHEVELNGAKSQMFEDRRTQYAFRGQAGDLLLTNKGNMGVALFDVYMPEFDDEEYEA